MCYTITHRYLKHNTQSKEGYEKMEMKIGVYKSINEKKGIIAINFINPLSGKKTTKSIKQKEYTITSTRIN